MCFVALPGKVLFYFHQAFWLKGALQNPRSSCLLHGPAQYIASCGVKSYRALLERSWVLSHVWIFVTLWTIAHQAPLSMGFPRQEYWSELPFPPPRDLPDQGLNLCLLRWQADSLPLWHQVRLAPKGSWHCPRSGLFLSGSTKGVRI